MYGANEGGMQAPFVIRDKGVHVIGPGCAISKVCVRNVKI